MAIKILVVDDEPDFQEFIRRRFRKETSEGNFEFIFAFNGQEALEKLKNDKEIHIILVDINMPIMNGLELLAELPKLNRLYRALVVSAYGDMSNVRKAMNLGASDFVTKPIEIEDFKLAIHNAIKQYQSLLEAQEMKEHVSDIQKELKIPPSYTCFDVSMKQQTLQALHGMIDKIESLEAEKTEPIAIVGMACCFPGAKNLKQFWDLLVSSRDPITEVPPDRWNIEEYYDTNLPGKIVTRLGGFIQDVDKFDASFFGVSPKEADTLDPQQRFLMEVAWEALEHAGIVPENLRGSKASIFVGIASNDYELLMEQREHTQDIDSYLMTGKTLGAGAGRLANFLGVHGECIAIDTSTSSSLVAVHHACQNLRRGDSPLAIAAGVNIILSPTNSLCFSAAHVLAKDGHCKAFDVSADGTCLSEGCGVVILKRLKDAVNDKDRILAVIRSSTVNQNGDTDLLVAPNREAQAALIHEALFAAGLKPEEIDYIEAHGTGTPLGDLTEIQALKEIFKGNRKQPLLLGSVKSNIGHLVAAAGIASLIKTVLALHFKKIPKNLNLTKINPLFALEEVPAQIIAENHYDWGSQNQLRRAGVSSFGFTGTNSHLIVEEAPSVNIPVREDRSSHLLTLSAKDEEALRQSAKNIQLFLSQTNHILADIAYTANTGRQHFPYRIAIIAQTVEEAIEKLNRGEYRQGSATASFKMETCDFNDLEKLAEMYCQGALIDWVGFYKPNYYSYSKVDLPSYPFQHKRYWSASLEQPTQPQKTKNASILLQRLSDALPTERKEILIHYLQGIVEKILGVTSINPELGFFSVGMDSLKTEELQEIIQADIGTIFKFPTTLAFDYPSVQKLIGYFEENIFPLIGIKADLKASKRDTPIAVVETEQIAIIGMGCRFPGGANNPDLFWKLLKEGYDGITEIPSDRWDIDSIYDPNPDTPGKMYVRTGGFLNIPIDGFDANFFGISRREAEYMDPQQRLLLEVAWEALENACINPLSIKGSEAGVFMGLCFHDYFDLLSKTQSADLIDAYLTSGNTASILAGRLSYILGLQGPSVTLDTACSSSLVAINYACESLKQGKCPLAIAGGVNILLNPDVHINFCKANMLAKDGHCKTFDAEADGYARSEGCGVIILKRLSDAIRDHDRILGVVRASDLNQDGATSGLTVPNGESQAALIRRVLEEADLEPASIDYIEAHGTGTALGDPIEFGALGDIFKGRQEPLVIGSVKTNIGHLEAAAGIAGVIKTVLSLNHEIIPPHLHFQQVNPRISLESIPAKIPLTLTSWKHSNRPRIAGISSFGFSGTNAHIIIEEPPILESKQNPIDRPWHLLTLSAKTQAALDHLMEIFNKELPENDLADIAYTTNTGRAHFPYRATVIAKTKDELITHLQTGDYFLAQAPAKPPKLIFLFKGETIESSELMETSPVFKNAMEQSKGLVEYAFYELLKSWGIAFDYVAGEGKGDIVAAIAAGVIPLEDGIRLMEAKPEDLDEVAKKIHYQKPQIGMLSSWTGQVIRQEGVTADYWKPHETVRNIPEDTFAIISQTNWKELLQTLSQLYLNGIPIDWTSFDMPYHRKKIPLPTYPFQRESYWVEALKMQKKRLMPSEAHPLLGEAIPFPFEERIFRNEIDLDFLPYLKDHRVLDNILFPGASYAEIMHAAGIRIFKKQPFVIKNLVFEQPLALNEKNSTTLEFIAKPIDKGYETFIYSIREQEWIRHAKSEFSLSEPSHLPELDWEQLRGACQNSIKIEELYNQFNSVGIHYGKQFQTLQKIWFGNNEFIAELEGESATALIDGSLQVLSFIMKDKDDLYLASSIDQIRYFSEPLSAIRIHGKKHDMHDGRISADVDIFSYDGQPLISIQGFRIGKTNRDHLQQLLARHAYPEVRYLFYEKSWLPKPLEKTVEQLKQPWLIVSEKEEIIEGLQSKSIKPEEAAEEIKNHSSFGILWFISGKRFIKRSS